MDVRDLILKQRQAVMSNINRQFGVSAPAPIEKAQDDELEKGKWQIGMTKDYQGVTYVVAGFNAKGTPLWKKKKDGSKGDGDTDDSGSNKTSTDTRKINPDNIGKKIISAMKADQGLLSTDAKGKKLLNKMALAAEEFIRNNPKLNLSDDDLQEIVGGDTEPYEKMKGWDKLNRAIDNYIDSEDEDDSTDSIPAVKKLSDLKTGDTVALIMERYNPQLGDYVTIKKVQIERATSKSFVVDYKKFDKISGERNDPSSVNYGSAKYYILLPQEVKNHIKDGKWKGDRISGDNPFEDTEEE